MGRLTGENIEKFVGGGGSKKRNYLTLKDHGDTASGRILCNSAADIEGWVVHRVKVGDYEREVNCLFDEGGRPDDCPFCKAKIGRAAKIYIPFYDRDADEIKIFERPNTYYSKVSGYCSRYSPIVEYDVDIVRNGAKNYSKTDYDIFPGKPDGTTIEDILEDLGVDEVPQILGTYVLNKTAEEMEYYLAHNDFPSDDAVDEPPVRRRNSSERGEDTGRRAGRRF